VPNFLESKRASIDFDTSGDTTRITVGDIGEAVFEPLKGPSGEPTRVLHGAAAFRDDVTLAKGTGTRFHDPDLRDGRASGTPSSRRSSGAAKRLADDLAPVAGWRGLT
jgi:hypothetical protein